jgi:hypothetical protein
LAGSFCSWRKEKSHFCFLKKKSNNQNHQDIAVYSSTRDISNYFLSFSQLELVACFQLLSLALQTGQMTSIAPQNLDGWSEIQKQKSNHL